MFKRLIVPLDGSRLSESVLPMVVDLAQKLQAIVILVHVIERNPPEEIHGEPHLSRPNEAERYLDEVEGRYFSPDCRVDKHVHKTAITDVAHAIIEHAREFESDLVVMSTHGRGGVGKLLFGTIAQQIASEQSTPVLVLQPVQGKTTPILSGHPFLVPLDGTTVREKALPVASSLASLYRVDLKLLMVVPTLETLSGIETTIRTLLPGTTKELLNFALKDAEEYVHRLVLSLRTNGSQATSEVRRGNLARVIVAEANRLKVDLIVMGTEGKAGLNAFWSGSLAPKVADRTRLALLLVPNHG